MQKRGAGGGGGRRAKEFGGLVALQKNTASSGELCRQIKWEFARWGLKSSPLADFGGG